MSGENVNYFKFWGKADAENHYHPAVCHMLDVGIVSRELLRVQSPQLQNRLLSLFEPVGENGLAFIAALHDLGKISPGFQMKREDFCRQLIKLGYDFPRYSEPNHGKVAACCLPDILQEEMKSQEDRAFIYSQVLAAHHGVFLGFPEMIPDKEVWNKARRTIVRFLADIFCVKSLDKAPVPSSSDTLLFAGLLTVADWLGSSEQHFPFAGTDIIDVSTYIGDREVRAKALIRELRMDSVLVDRKTFDQLFPFHPNPCQEAVMKVAEHLQHPMLIVVESPMGTGKTEAALATFSCIAGQNGLRGMYYALPTQATGNAMFHRMRSFLERLDLSGQAQFHLIHANADLNPEYEELQLRNIGEPEDESENNVVASSWFTARKRGILSSYGTGTIDQALMAVLKVRHFFVRLFGLSGKAVVLDEVHAYDAYMTEEISRLIGWLSRNNSSVLLLSATLPKHRREKLLAAFSYAAQLPSDIRYPCVIGVDVTGKTVCEEIEDLEQSSVILAPILCSQEEKIKTIVRILHDRLANGGCSACILNTISEAQAVYAAVKETIEADEIILFHSRFTLERRLKIEEHIITRYGKERSNRPSKGVVIATQVLEQSLDVDFDLMVSDLAPIDLLLQRAGRLHRHDNPRPPLLSERIIYTIMPDVRTGKPDFGKSKFVYFPDILIKTALLFVTENAYEALEVDLPYGVSKRIEAVYGDEQTLLSGTPKTALEKWIESRIGSEMAQRYAASTVSLADVRSFDDDPCYFLGNLANNEDEERIVSSRLSRQSVRLVVVADDAELTVRSKEDAKRLYGLSIVTDNPGLVQYFKSQDPPAVWKDVALLSRCYALKLSQGTTDLGRVVVKYDDHLGLQITRKKEAK